MADFTRAKNELEQLFEIESENRIPCFVHPQMSFSATDKEEPAISAMRSYLVYLLGQYYGKKKRNDDDDNDDFKFTNFLKNENDDDDDREGSPYWELKKLIRSIDDGSWSTYFHHNKAKRWVRIKAHPPELEYFGSGAKGSDKYMIPIAIYY